MKIGLFDVDSVIPNLALMKISSYHKSIGDEVELYQPIFDAEYDHVYASKVFAFPHKNDHYIRWNDSRWSIGGSGVDLKTNLPENIASQHPDYELYGIDYNIGFAMRGCRLKCSFCVVPDKEGKARSDSGIKDLLTNPLGNGLVLLDNDFFGNPDWKTICNELISLQNKVSISQGINFRIVTDEQLAYLSRINFRDINLKRRRIYTAWDNIKDEKHFISGVERSFKTGILPSHLMVYVLIGYNSSKEEDLYRVEKLRSIGADPFVMPFDKTDSYQRDFTRWVNNKAVFKTVPFEEYSVGRYGIKRKTVLSKRNDFGLFAC